MKFPRLVHNRVSYLGLAVAAIAFIVFVLLFALQALFATGRAPYAGLVTFVLVPGILTLGLLLVPAGMGIEWKRRRQEGAQPLPPFPIIDMNNSRHRNAALVFVSGSIIVLFLFTLSGYQAYHFTESVTFCGTLCHTVMKPEYTTYRSSPHARVDCVACHVGPGATWFVRSKISGIPQIFAVLAESYQRPIPTPVHNLRPAQHTCEQCHWPEAFYGGQQKKIVHFLPDEANTRWEINLLIKTGGGSPETSLTEGIHWHMNISNLIEYIAADEKRQNILWVRMTNVKSGKTTEYFTEKPLAPAEIAKANVRTMDCMDCHNRPSHIFRPPNYSVNLSLAYNRMDPSLPFLKRTAIQLLANPYDSEESALREIETGMRKFYSENYPQLAKAKEPSISAAIAETQNIFRQNIFPTMKVRWDTHPDNLGHLNFLGCDRCHDGKHKTAGGVAITTTCNACHLILSQGAVGKSKPSMSPEGLDFQHPVDIGDAWKETLCSECHTGGPQ